MPFPLAHPAAVLPFRRSKLLNFPALVIGAIVPDVGYCFVKYDLEGFTHSIRGCFEFSLPVGLLLLLIYYAVCEPLVNLLPAPHRQALRPACRPPRQPWFAAPLSLLIGAVTHVIWDSFTHETGWCVERSSFLQLKVFIVQGYDFRMYRLLWHISSLAGLLILARAYGRTLKSRIDSAPLVEAEERRRYALWVALLLLPLLGAVPTAFLYYHYPKESSPVNAVSQFLRLSAALYLVVLTLVLVALGATLKMKRRSTA